MSTMMTSSNASCPGCSNPRPAPAQCCDVIPCQQCRLQLCKGQLSNLCSRCSAVDQAAKSLRDRLANEIAKLEEMLLEVEAADRELAQQDEWLAELKRRVVEEMERKIALIRADGKALENELEKMANDGKKKRRDITVLQFSKILEELRSRCRSWIERSSADVVRNGETWWKEAAGVVVTSRGRWSAVNSKLDPVDFSPLKLNDWLPSDVNIVGEIVSPSRRSNISQHKTRNELQSMAEKLTENQRLLQSKLRECDHQQQLSKRQLESMSRRVDQLETVNRQQKLKLEDLETKEQDLTERRLKDAARIKEMECDLESLDVSRHAAESRTREVGRLCQQLGSRLADAVQLADQRADDLEQYRLNDVTATSTRDDVGIMTSCEDEMAEAVSAAATDKKWRENCPQHIQLIGETQAKLRLSYRIETELRREILKLQEQQREQQQQQQQEEQRLHSDKGQNSINRKYWMLVLCNIILALVIFFIIWYQQQSVCVGLIDPVTCLCPVSASSVSDKQMLVNNNSTDHQHFCSRTQHVGYCNDG